MKSEKGKELSAEELRQKNSWAVRYTKKFWESESAGGILLLVCTLVALIFANIPSLRPVLDIWEIEGGIEMGGFSLKMSLLEWVNDALMAIFFFTVGLEIKREMCVGRLASIKRSVLPIFAALGGMIFPALIFTIFNAGNPDTAHGWGVPMATDIAFAVGILAILGSKAPIGVKVLLTAIAIVDDLGSIIVLAIFYPTHAIHFDFLLLGLLLFAALYFIGRAGVRKVWVTVLGGILLWYFIYRSGVHATIAGVLLAITVPYKTKINELRFGVKMQYMLDEFKKVSSRDVAGLANNEEMHIIHQMSEDLDDIEPMMHKFESNLQPIVNFLIMPLFALANAAVTLNMDFSAPGVTGLSLGIFFGLLLGKPIGIYLFSMLSVKCKLAMFPEGMNKIQLLAMGVLAGIGFTMSIFIDNLAFHDPALVNTGKVAILITSATAAVVGYLIFSKMSHKDPATKKQ
ncbi:MAG: Na+/H+ antiporter NhaA [Bacteroidales bacterium]|nr:Na+/H+ antiporter NhaA [Bacteroidales bacterium]